MNSILSRVFARIFLLCMLGLTALPFAAWADDVQGFILQSSAPYDDVTKAVEALGGTVTHKYENVGAVAVQIPADRRMDLFALAGVEAVYKDRMVNAPRPAEIVSIDATEIEDVLSASEYRELLGSDPDDFFSDLFMNRAGELLFNGIDGSGVIVAVIDSGTANNPAVVPAIAGRVIGGENFVPGAAEPSATSTLNGNHGTWVGTTIAADIGFLFSTAGTVSQSLLTHDPGSIIPDFIPGLSLVPMVGTAPGADLYAMKTFAAAGGGAPESRIIAAMDRAITLRRNFNDGMPSVPVSGDGSEENPFVFDSLNIQIVNMSLGGPNLFAGRDLEDQLTRTMLDVGITLVASAGNSGHAAMTGGSPGTGIGTLTVGAASPTSHERFLRDLQFGLGFGALFRPADHHQTATFSSRGPTADGRIDPELTASGFANFAMGASGGLSVVSGTSFSSPTVAGIAAQLRQAAPAASATQIRNALLSTANPNLLGDGSGPLDQGNGFVDAVAALDSLLSGSVDESLDFGIAKKRVEKNLEHAGITVHDCKNSPFTEHYDMLLPGQVGQLFVEARRDTSRIDVSYSNIAPELPPAQQNLFFGDDLFVEIQNAPTSFGALAGGGFFASDTTISVDNPQTGIVRIATMGDWTNAGRISADVTISCVKTSEGDETADGEVAQGENDILSFDMPAGTSEAVIELSWKHNWGHYPTDDLDLILVDPVGGVSFAGATLDSPERVVLANPMGGTWTAIVSGFTVFGDSDDDDDSDSDDDDEGSDWELRVTADGDRLDDD